MPSLQDFPIDGKLLLLHLQVHRSDCNSRDFGEIDPDISTPIPARLEQVYQEIKSRPIVWQAPLLVDANPNANTISSVHAKGAPNGHSYRRQAPDPKRHANYPTPFQ